MANPIGWEIYATAVTAGLDPLFDHFFAVYFKLYLIIRRRSGGFILIINFFLICVFYICHGEMPLPLR